MIIYTLLKLILLLHFDKIIQIWESFITKNLSNNTSYSLVSKYRVLESNEWIFNFNVTQYSSIIFKQYSTNDLIIQSLVFYDQLENVDYFKNYTICLINVDDKLHKVKPLDIISIPLMNIRQYPKLLCKITCKYNDLKDIDKIKIAVIDIKYYDYYNQVFNYSSDLISFQKPYKSNESKKKIINCVHLVRNLNENQKSIKLFNWLDLMQSFGYERIVLYIYNITQETESYLIEKSKNFRKMTVELVKYKTSFTDVCSLQIKLLSLKGQNSSILEFLYKTCLNSFQKHFKMDEMIFNSHERMSSNDCLMRHKNDFEFLTNLDFDEFIFPRLHDTLFYDTKSNSCNMYDYTKRLQNKYGYNIAYFQFDHMLILQNFNDFINKLLHLKMKQYQSIKYEQNAKYIKFELKTVEDINILKKYQNITLEVNKLNRTLYNNHFHSKWNNLYGFKMNIRDGKSIFVTDYVQSYNQHFAVHISSNKRGLSVPLIDGYVSHFRDDISGFIIDKTLPFNYLRFDLEYYLYFLNISRFHDNHFSL